MRRHGEHVILELPDLIRMNRLVRGGIDIEGFAVWFEQLGDDEGRGLIDTVITYACEAGVTEPIYAEALRRAGLSVDDAWVATLTDRFRGDGPDRSHRGLQRVRDDIKVADRAELRRLLGWAVHVFGVAEGRVSADPAESCNHWWHRDLTDDRVVQDLLHDPKYYKTAKRDDLRVKAPWWRRPFS